jgi:hypothetical protein
VITKEYNSTKITKKYKITQLYNIDKNHSITKSGNLPLRLIPNFLPLPEFILRVITITDALINNFISISASYFCLK